MAEPRYDEFGVPLMQSGVSDAIWELRKTDPAAFKVRVREYFAVAYPSFTVEAATVNEREKIIWLKDERRTLLAKRRNDL
ncbi:hypothetical protein GXP70_12315 [Paenibacillus lycopersici]|uniref:Uncharacterized protein n=1 Tax=Paenibacillus lycopersici TaxID=2704462 RepID=A0A6C0FU21_9BACL|nr:hypothetical protein [Paenibacillus lycopersici]QHT60646.1 hypothetical protein GXP70_12315 [Paenibacillus lycopersici]